MAVTAVRQTDNSYFFLNTFLNHMLHVLETLMFPSWISDFSLQFVSVLMAEIYVPKQK